MTVRFTQTATDRLKFLLINYYLVPTYKWAWFGRVFSGPLLLGIFAVSYILNKQMDSLDYFLLAFAAYNLIIAPLYFIFVNRHILKHTEYEVGLTPTHITFREDGSYSEFPLDEFKGGKYLAGYFMVKRGKQTFLFPVKQLSPQEREAFTSKLQQAKTDEHLVANNN